LERYRREQKEELHGSQRAGRAGETAEDVKMGLIGIVLLF